MDDSRFDAWTRRQFGRAVSGGFASLLRLGAFTAAITLARPITTQAKRCLNVRQPCNPANDKKRQRCCGHLRCGEQAGRDGDHCCRPIRTQCRRASECCGNLQCDTTIQSGRKRCCAGGGDFCQRDQACCRGTRCDIFQRACV